MRHRFAAFSGYLLLVLLIALLTVLPAGPVVQQAGADAAKCETCDPGGSIFGHSANSLRRHGLIRYTPQQIEAENRLLETAPLVKSAPPAGVKLLSDGYTESASRNLLPLLSYDPNQRDQGYGCGSCWVWAGTGCLEVALNAQRGIKDRLSVQYFTSTYNGGLSRYWACCGGNASYFASHYNNNLKKAIPWSNANAAYVDGSRTCYGSTAVPAGSISTTPSYPVSSVTAARIPTYSTDGVNQATAIQNIKSVLDRNRAIYFGFSQANDADWDRFFDFWNYQPESYIWPYGYSCGSAWTSGGGGHGVLCVGYDDTPEGTANDYWVMLNSWGTATGRPNGLFRVPMYYDYNCSISGYGYSTRWWTIEPVFTGGTSITQRLVGTDTPGNANTSANRLILGRFQADQTGNLSEIRVYSRASGNVKAAVYSDSAGQPGTRLGYNNTPTTVTAGRWNTIFIPSTSVTAGTYYWLAAANDAAGAISFNSAPGSGASKGKTISFSSFTFPATAGTGFTSYTYQRSFAGWGEFTSSATPTQRLVGTDTPGNASTSANRLILGRFQADQTGNISEIRVYSRASGNVKAAVYSDSAGQPGTRLGYNNTSTAVTAGRWNTISIPSTSVTAGTYYWLAAANDAAGAISYNNASGSGASKGRTITFSSFTFPASAGTGFTSYTYQRAFAAWGD